MNKKTVSTADAEFKARAKALVAQMTLEEKVSQMLYTAKAVPRLGIPEYNWWNEALHGVARAGVSTMFPQAIGMAATFDAALIGEVGDVISTEGRAKHHAYARQGDFSIYKGLTYWSPNINIFRDPRWGRGQETYGEDPYLTGELGKAFVKGLQGSDPKYLKAAACAKHYAVHSGPENDRHTFDAKPTPKDFWETYMYAFEECVEEAGVEAVMGAYNSVYGSPCNGSNLLMNEILRDKWGFEGHVVSDCWAIKDFHESHHVTDTPEQSVALAVKSGCDLNCGDLFWHLLAACRHGLVTEDEITRAVERLMVTRMRLGMFDDPEGVPFTKIPYTALCCDKHSALSLEAARASMVLLKNDGVLPLDKTKLKSIAVIGPNADSRRALAGNYEGTPPFWVTPLEGIRAAVEPDTRVYFAEGCHLYQHEYSTVYTFNLFAEAVEAARISDVAVVCLGLDATIEGEEQTSNEEHFGGDKKTLNLPGYQLELLHRVVAVGKPTIVVVMTGSALALGWADDNASAVLNTWYPGQDGGTALADILFGKVSPSGRLPVTFYADDCDLPDFLDYSMQNRTYRYYKGKPVYPFGYGLSYTDFEYTDLTLNKAALTAGEALEVSVTLTNTGKYKSAEVAQLYLTLPQAEDAPLHSLKGFKRVTLEPGESRRMVFTLRPKDLAAVSEDGRRVITEGRYTLFVGGSQPDTRSLELTGQVPVSTQFTINGSKTLD